jgi:hypothetical protein
VVGGLIYGAYLMHVPAHWIAVGAIVLLGIGVLTGGRRSLSEIRPLFTAVRRLSSCTVPGFGGEMVGG